MTPVRVLHVIPEMGTGGAETLVAELVRHDGAAGWVSGVASAGGVRADELRVAGVPTFAVADGRRSGWGMVRAVWALRRALRRFRPDVVVAHNVKATVASRLAMRRRRRRPLLTVFHGVAEGDYPRAARLLRGRPDRVVAVSADAAARLRGHGLTDPEPVVVPNAVAVRELPDRARARQELGLVADAPVVLCLARLVPQKRHDVLLRAWACLGTPGAVLLLAGDGPMLADLRLQAEQLGISGSVYFLGARTDVDALLAAADVTVLASDWEGLPLAALESMAAGRPVVATEVGELPDLLAGGAGVVVPPGRPDALAAALDGLLADPDARSRAGRVGVAAVERRYHPDAMVARYDDLLRGLASEWRATVPPRRRRRRTVALTLVAMLLAGGGVFGLAALRAPEYQARVGVIAAPSTRPVVGDPAGKAQYGEVVSLGMAGLVDLATSPSVLRTASATVDGAPDPATLAERVSVELVPGAGVARVSVRSGSARTAAELDRVIVDQLIKSDLFTPVAALRRLDEQAAVVRIAPDPALAAGLGLVAAALAGVCVLALRQLFTRAPRGSALADAIAGSNGSRPVAILPGSDPALVSRIRVLQRVAGRPLRVIGLAPELADRAGTLSRAVHGDGTLVHFNGEAGRAAVVGVAQRGQGRDELAAALSALPDPAELIAVVVE
ncbi:glycosyltransferase [Pseudonocardia acaciae]|uniref:glycosyltransferase n=1 Tax=Pseudonocardia acaciae TaxID=551276 RepID=UPI000A48865A|nr:glycosyltransferase [Pseudonocardia acaciae]